MRHVDGVCLVWSKVSRAMALVIIKFTQRHPCCWAAGHHYQSTTEQQPEPQKTILSPTLELAIHQSSRRHQNTALHSATALEALAKVRAQFQAKLPASSGKARLPGPITSDHTLLNTSSCLDHTENIFADQLVI